MRGEVAGLNVELLERVRSRKYGSDRQIGIRHVHAVQEVVVRARTVSVHDYTLMLALPVRHAIVVVGDTRHDVLQLQGVAAIERKVDNTLCVDDLADGCIHQVYVLPGVACDLHDLGI